MDDNRRDSTVRDVRDQQHTGNHDRPATEGGGENLEIGSARPEIVYVVTRDDGLAAGRDPAVYARQLAVKLKPFGVTVRYLPDQRGRGGLIGIDDSKLEVDIRQAIAQVDTELGTDR